MRTYAPTICSILEVKDQFYEDLDATIGMASDSETQFLLGDFNASVGQDHKSWPDSIGHLGVGRMNGSGQRLLKLCSYHKHEHVLQHKATSAVPWMHPRSHHWHQLALIINRRAQLQSALITRSYHSPGWDMDHSFMRRKVRLWPFTDQHHDNSRHWTLHLVYWVCQDCFGEPTSSWDHKRERWSLLQDTIYSPAALKTARNEGQRTAVAVFSVPRNTGH